MTMMIIRQVVDMTIKMCNVNGIQTLQFLQAMRRYRLLVHGVHCGLYTGWAKNCITTVLR